MSFLSILAVRSSKALLSLIHRGGSLPGSIGLKIDPDSLKKIKIDGPVILVTGTNGKTSTTNMIAQTFETAGYRVVSNLKGDNLKAGITTSLLDKTKFSGHLKGNAVVLEVDELNIRHVLPQLPVSALVVNNFFRDQLDRAREMDQLISTIEKSIQDFKGTLILNGNDPNVLRLQLAAPQAKVVTFGLDKNSSTSLTTKEAMEGKFCPSCGHELQYDYYQYSHIGKFSCSYCGFSTPKLDVCLKNIHPEKQSFTFEGKSFKGPYEGLYSMYNYAALLAIVKQFQLPLRSVVEVFSNAPKPFGRNESFDNKGQKIILNLIKNPTGANEVMKVIEKDQEEKDVVIVLNDKEQDGTDVSWIYDTAFEKIMDLNTKTIVCTGTRANDMALRLWYGGYKGTLFVTNTIEEALQNLTKKHKKLYIIATYTALLPARQSILKEVSQ